MSFSKFLLNKTTNNCIKSIVRNNQNLKTISNNYLSINTKCFHSLNTLQKSQLIVKKLIVNTSARSLSTAQTDTTIDFKPEPNENVIDLSGAIDTNQLVSNLVNTSDLPITALNLASNYTPVGWILHMLEAIHQVLPWWSTIAVATLVFRLAMFPLVIKAQKNAVKMNQVMPQLQQLQQKTTNARLSGNQMEFAKYTAQQQELLVKNGINPLKNLLVPAAQAPIFISFFLCLRRMAQLPVESLKVGGILWFVDLTVPDPYHLLPIITCMSLWATLELGVESGLNTNSGVVIKTMMRVVPAVTLVFIWKFEAAILMYWCTSNFISLLQVMLLKQKPIRKYLNIPQQVKHKPEELIPKKGFYASIKESMDNSKVFKKLEERKRIDEINFKKAAIGPIKKTYKTDPTKLENRN